MAEGLASPEATLRDYVRIVWRRKLIVVGMCFILVALALAYSFVKTPLYEAAATLVYEPSIDVTDPLSTNAVDASTREVELNSVGSLIASPGLISSARASLKPEDLANGFAVKAAPEQTTGAGSGSTVLITAVSTDPETAARAANGYALAFTDFRRQQVRDRLRQAEEAVQSKLDEFTSEASRQTADYVTLLQRLQDLQISQATATGNFRVLIPATEPLAPFTPKPARNAVVGLAAGLVLGIGLVLLLEQFDTRVRTADEAMRILGMPIVGTLPKLSASELSKGQLVVLGDPHGFAAEAIHKLRGNLEFANLDGDLNSLFVTSALQHEGKTMTVCNLALSLAATGVRVVLVDGDLRRPQVHACLSLKNGTGVSTVVDAIQCRYLEPRMSQFGGRGKGNESATKRLHVLTSGPTPPNPAEVVASRSFAQLIDELQQQFDLVILDVPSVLAVGDPAAMARYVDGLMFLVDLTRAKRPLLEEAARQINQMPCRKLGLIVVKQASRHTYRHETYYRT